METVAHLLGIDPVLEGDIVDTIEELNVRLAGHGLAMKCGLEVEINLEDTREDWRESPYVKQRRRQVPGTQAQKDAIFYFWPGELCWYDFITDPRITDFLEIDRNEEGIITADLLRDNGGHSPFEVRIKTRTRKPFSHVASWSGRCWTRS